MFIQRPLSLNPFIAVILFRTNCSIFFQNFEQHGETANWHNVFQFKLERKTAEAARDINDLSGPGKLLNARHNGSSRNSVAVTRALKMTSIVSDFQR